LRPICAIAASDPLALTSLHVTPGGALRGRLKPPGDKSISHRAALLGALACGRTEIDGFLASRDCLATLGALRALGVDIRHADNGRIRIEGRGAQALKAPAGPLDLGNSGTGLRLLAGVLAAQPFTTTLTGDRSLQRRPMARLVEPLERMGARLATSANGTAPMTVGGASALRAIDYTLPVASAQLKSAILLAGLYARGETRVREPAVTRDHTERLLRLFGVECQTEDGLVRLAGEQPLRAAEVSVPGDLSAAAFFLIGASIAPGSDLVIENVGVNPTRTGILDVLAAMGADIERRNERTSGGEPVADLKVRAAPLKGIEVPPDIVSRTIDEFPALLIAAALAEGETVVRGAAELRVKESDRLAAMAAGLERLGVPVEVWEDGIRVSGQGGLRGGTVESYGDHRIAMAFAVAGARADGPLDVLDCANVATSFPDFAHSARRVGLDIYEEASDAVRASPHPT
jgi:3-phosphoshikimate 1-carboxyvinyltransferase